MLMTYTVLLRCNLAFGRDAKGAQIHQFRSTLYLSCRGYASDNGSR